LEEAVPQFQSKNIKIKKKLPPLISAREEELYKLKVPELKQIIKEKRLKPGNKEQMIKQILKSENIEEGVRWGDKWLYKDLQRQHYINDSKGNLFDKSPSIEKLEIQINSLENKLKNTKFEPGYDGRTKRRLLQDSLELYKERLQETKALMARDLQKEYDANIKKREENSKRFDDMRKQEKIQSEFIPLEEAMPQFQSKNIKIKKPIDFIPLEEAIPTKKIHKAKIEYNAIVPYVPKPQPQPQPQPKPQPKPEPKPQFDYEADKKRFKS
jgi:hypothetical protein